MGIDDGDDLEAKKEQGKPLRLELPTLLSDDICSFVKEELNFFVKMSHFFNPNPRKIKRITNIYTAVRMLLPALQEVEEPTEGDHGSDKLKRSREKREAQIKFREKLLCWIVLCEQWPVRMCWILQMLEDNEQAYPDGQKDPSKKKQKEELQEKGLGDLFFDHVETVVYDIDGRKSLPEAIKKKYQKVGTNNEKHRSSLRDMLTTTLLCSSLRSVQAYSLDSDPEVFDQLIVGENCGGMTVSDIGTNMTKRRDDKLLSFTINLNPALRELIASIAAYREEEKRIKLNALKRYKRLSVHSVSSKNKSVSRGGPQKNSNVTRKNTSTTLKTKDGRIRSAKELAPSKAPTLEPQEPADQKQPKSGSVLARNDQGEELVYELYEPDQQDNPLTLPQDDAKLDDEQSKQGQHISDQNQDENGPKRKTADPVDATEQIKEEGEGALKDDMRGVDHVGIEKYALRLSQLIVLKLETPSVFGVYAMWGSGKR